MKVIFIKDHQSGRKGEIKEVSDGFGQNFLIPKGFARVATEEIQAKIAKEGKESEAKKLKEVEKLKEIKSEIEKKVFVIKVKVGDKGQIFGGVHEKDIASAITSKLNHTLEKNQISKQEPIKQVGEHKVEIKLGNGQTATAKINVEAQ